MQRRTVLTGTGATLSAAFGGCLNESNEPPNTDGSHNQTDTEGIDDLTPPEENSSESDSQDDEEYCQIERQSPGYGRADSIDETIKVDEIKDAEQECEQIALDNIFTQVKEETDLNDVSDEKNWLSTSVTGGRITLSIWSETNQSGNLVRCPPSEYQYEDFAASVPNKITITLQSDDDLFTWSRKVVIEHRFASLD